MSRLIDLGYRTWVRVRRRVRPPDPAEYSTLDEPGVMVPCQVEAYFLAVQRYVPEGGSVLDVGCGEGYGLTILGIKAAAVSGVDVDARAVRHCLRTLAGRHPRLRALACYDGYTQPFADKALDVVTCVDVLEHVPDYDRLVAELLRVATFGVLVSTPNRRPETTRADGRPTNVWHLREWVWEGLDAILRRHGDVERSFLNGPFSGPFAVSSEPRPDTLALTPFLRSRRAAGGG